MNLLPRHIDADSRHARRMAERQATLDRSRERAGKRAGTDRCALCGANGHRAPVCPMRGALR